MMSLPDDNFTMTRRGTYRSSLRALCVFAALGCVVLGGCMKMQTQQATLERRDTIVQPMADKSERGMMDTDGDSIAQAPNDSR